MFEYVVDLKLKPSRPYAKRSKTNLIIQHHASGQTPQNDADAYRIVRSYHKYHISKGNRGIDYNFLVAPSGTVIKGRGLEYQGGGVLNSGASAGMNARSVQICALGNLEVNPMPESQKEGIMRLTRDLVQYFGIKEIIPHQQVKNTDCPGRLYPFHEIKNYALSSEPIQPDKPDTPPAEGSFNAIVNVGTLNLRERDSKNSDILATLKSGDKLILDRYVENEDWARVWFGDILGYVWLPYIKVSESESGASQITYKVNVGTLNFREAPSRASKIIKVLEKGDKVTLERYVPEEAWARVSIDGAIGYVWANYISE